MRKAGTTAALAIALVAFGASSAMAWTIHFKPEPRYDWHEIETACSSRFDCVVHLTIRAQRRVVYRKAISSYYGGSAFYRWSCRRDGRHRWIARGDDGAVKRGSFTIGRCTPRRDRKVGRARASYADARAQRDDVYVSSVRCRPTRVARGPAARWTCLVTWNDNIRECTDRDRLWFWKRRKFGTLIEDYWLRSRRVGCRYF